MTWYEFYLRKLGWERENVRKWERLRFQSYYTLVSTGALDDRKMTINQFLPLPSDKEQSQNKDGKRLKDIQRELYRKAIEEANKMKKKDV